MAKLTKEQQARIIEMVKEWEKQDPPLTSAEIQSKVNAEKENMLAAKIAADKTNDLSVKTDSKSKEDATQVDALVEQKNTASDSEGGSSDSQEEKTNEEKKSVRQASELVSAESELA